MSVIEVERPAAPAPSRRSFAQLWDLGVRLILLVVVLAGVVTVLPSLVPQSRPLGQFLDDLRADKVTAVRHRSGSDQVQWADGWTSWYAGDIAGSLPTLGTSPDGLQPFSNNGDINDVAYDWIRHALDVTGRNKLSSQVDAATSHMPWTEAVPWHGLSTAASLASVLAFVLMLGKGGKRYGNRWAWFWVFALGGFFGPLLYLALEPSPAWPGRAGDASFPDRPRFLGGGGFVIGLAIKGALAAGAFAVLSWI